MLLLKNESEIDSYGYNYIRDYLFFVLVNISYLILL